MRTFSFRSLCLSLLAYLAVVSGASLSAQSLNYVPVIGTYAGGASQTCANATDGYGDGCPATQAILSNPWMSASDAQGNLYFSDLGNNLVRRIDAKTNIITLVAGGGTVCAAKTNAMGDGCPATQATLKAPQGVRFDLNGNLMIADGGNNRVRRIDAATGIITTIAGTGTTATTPPSNTSPKAATLTNIGNPFGLAIDKDGNLYMACGAQSAVLMVLADHGQITAGSSLIYTIAGTGTRGFTGDGGPGPKARLYQNRGVYIGADGSVYIGDQNNGAVRKVTSPFQGGTFNPDTTTITTIAGTGGTLGYSGDGGPATAALMDAPEDVFLDNANRLIAVGYGSTVAAGGDYIRQIDLTSGTISTLAGIGTRVTSGDGGAASLAGVQGPQGGNYDRFGNIFIGSCPACNVIRRISLNNYFLQGQDVGGTSASQNVILQASADTTLGAASIARSTRSEFVLGAPTGCSVGNALSSGSFCTLPVSFQPSYPGLRTAQLVAKDAAQTSTLGLWATGVAPMPSFGGASINTVAGTGTSLALGAPGAGAVDSQGNIFVADTASNTVLRIDAASGAMTTAAGNGSAGYSGDAAAATSASLNTPAAVAVDAAGNLYIADTGNNVVRFVNVDTGAISTVAGNNTADYKGDGGMATVASLSAPRGLVVDAGGNVYVADSGNNVIRKFARNGPITTFAGTGTAGATGDGGPATLAMLNMPVALAFDLNANLYVADNGNSVIRQINAAGQISTFAGTAGASGSNTGDGAAATAATLNAPSGLAVDAGGTVYIASGSQVRAVDAAGIITTVAGTGDNAAYSGENGVATAASLGSTNLSLMLDSAANLYIAAPSASRLLLVKSATAPSIDFGVQSAGTQGNPLSVPVRNAGNNTLTFTGITSSADFVLDTTASDACTSATTLAPGAVCALRIAFAPTADTGSVSGTVVLTDNALNLAGSTQTLTLSGVTHTVTSSTLTLAADPVAPVYGSAANLVATISVGDQPTGTVAFQVNGQSIGSATLSGTKATIALPILPAGAATLSATYSGDTRNTSSGATSSVTIAPAVLTVTAGNATRQQLTPNPTFTYTITGFVNGDTAATAITGTPALTTTATASSAQGTYPIVPAIGTLAASNYTFAFVNGTLTVGPPPPADFTLTASSTTLSVLDGLTVNTTVQLTSLYNYAGSAKLACTGLPKNVVCYFASSTLTGNPTATNAMVSTTLTVATDTVTKVTTASNSTRPATALALIGGPALLLLLAGARKRRSWGSLMMLAALFLTVAGISSCSEAIGSAVATPGTYSITVTATDGSASKSLPMTLTIN